MQKVAAQRNNLIEFIFETAIGTEVSYPQSSVVVLSKEEINKNYEKSLLLRKSPENSLKFMLLLQVVWCNFTRVS